MSNTEMLLDSYSNMLAVLDPREWMQAYCIPNFVNDDQIEEIKLWWHEDKAKAATIYTPKPGDDVVVKERLRVGHIMFVRPDSVMWFTEKLLTAIWDINQQKYGFTLIGMVDALQLTKYKPGDFYGNHRDTGTGKLRCRKLSFTIQLSDPSGYQGGDLEIHGQPNLNKEKGSLIVFPSFLLHQVTPLERGERWSLVSWITGSEWR